MKSVLLTGFEPFGTYTENPSQEVAKALSGTESRWLDYRIDAYPMGGGIPFDVRGIDHLLSIMFTFKRPELLVMMGQSFDPKQEGIVLERGAKNHIDYAKDNLADNSGYRPKSGKIIDGPEQYQTKLPIDELVKKLQRKGIKARASDDCGANFCNHSYYLALHVENTLFAEPTYDPSVVVENPTHGRHVKHLLDRPKTGFKTLFVHLPQYPQQTNGQGGRGFEQQKSDVKALIDEIVNLESEESFLSRALRYIRRPSN